MKAKIFVALSSFAEFGNEPLKLFEDNGFEYSLNSLGRRLIQQEIVQLGKDCEGIIAGVEPYDDYVLERMPKLRCISRCGVGIDNIDLGKAKEKGITVKNTPDIVTLPVAELTIGMIFDLLRKISYHTNLMKARQWRRKAGSLLSGSKIGVLGLGRIGKKVSEMLVGLNAVVYGADLSPNTSWAAKNKVEIVSKDFILRECDIITIHIASPEGEEFILSKKEIEAMKKGALLINTSRGKFLDETALCAALESNHLGGAALDVYSQEPYAGPLCDMDNVVLIPHLGSFTRESRNQMEIEAVKNAINFLK
ncbi:MAG: phosphoglycerate dehydrogenase [Candidatus Omnitrophota bacterium]|nr:phosphoglycerate dehydrogenase [Candidatus Omnitrophota bacterium]